MGMEQLTDEELWRAVILFGKNEATYKLALGQCLSQFVEQKKSWVSIHELAEHFFDIYRQRLANGKPQIRTTQTEIEKIIAQYNKNELQREAAISRVEKKAFRDVLARFHNLNSKPIPLIFYERQNNGLLLTDNVFKIFTADQKEDFHEELDTKWTLLEIGFEQRRTPARIQVYNDLKDLYIQNNGRRVNLTKLVPVLRGSQNGKCFYCCEDLGATHVSVDHFIPFQVVQHNEVWNLVLAHTMCNELKSDRIADPKYFDRLFSRNEDIIKIKTPLELASKIFVELGNTPSQRLRKMRAQYDDATSIIRERWVLRPGYDPETDPFFRKVIRAAYL